MRPIGGFGDVCPFCSRALVPEGGERRASREDVIPDIGDRARNCDLGQSGRGGESGVFDARHALAEDDGEGHRTAREGAV